MHYRQSKEICVHSNAYVCRHACAHKTIYIDSKTNLSCMDLFCLSLNSDPNDEKPVSNHLRNCSVYDSKNGYPIFPWNTSLSTRTQCLCTVVYFAVSVMLLKFLGSERFLQRFLIQFNSWVGKHFKTWILLLLLLSVVVVLYCVSIYTVTNVTKVSVTTAIYGVWFRFMAINVSVEQDSIVKNRNSSLSGSWSGSITSSRYAWAT